MSSHRPQPPAEKRRRRRKTDLERLLEKVAVDPATGCWNWTACRTPAGYGQFWFEYRRNNFSHRAAYMLLVGPIPAGMELDHLCRNRACCNPDHLEPVTHEENLRRGESPAAQNSRVTTCSQGHPLAGANLYVRPDRPSRDCRTCRRERSRKSVGFGIQAAKRSAIAASLIANPDWSDKRRARELGVNPKTVAKVRHGIPGRRHSDFLAEFRQERAA